MHPRIYIGNLPYTASEDEIRNFFAPRKVVEVKIINDHETGRPRGFAFVELASIAEVKDAVAALDGCELGGRSIKVSEAKERENRNRTPRVRPNNKDDDFNESWKR